MFMQKPLKEFEELKMYLS